MADKLTLFIYADYPWTKLTNQRGFLKASLIPKGKSFFAFRPFLFDFCQKQLVLEINTKFQSIRLNAH